MTFRTFVAGAMTLAVPATAIASAPPTLYPVSIGAETARYDRGRATVNLELPDGAVEIRPVSTEKGQVVLQVAVFNKSGRPANFGIENIEASVNGLTASLPTHDQLMAQARDAARDRKIATVLVAGLAAGAASTMSNSYTYRQRVNTPHGAYARTVRWEDDTPGIVGATAAVAGGAMVLHGIDRKLDYTLDRIDGSILQTTTVDPGNSFGGTVVVPLGKRPPLPADIRINVSWNGAIYPFGFRVTPPGMTAPPPFPATARSDVIPAGSDQPHSPDPTYP